MKVLVVSQHFWPESFRFNDLVIGLKEKGLDVHVLTGMPNYPGGDYYESYNLFGPYSEEYEGVTVYRCPLFPRKQNKICLALNYVSFPILASIWAIILYFKNHYSQTFVCQSSPIFMAIPAVILKMIFRVPCILWITDLWPESLRATNTIRNEMILGWVEKVVVFIYKRVDKILISCKGFEESIRDKVTNAQIEYFPYWADSFFENDLTNDDSAKVEKEWLDDTFKITFAGNIGEAQDFDNLIRAVKILSSKNLKFRMHILGEGRAMKKALALVKELGVEGYFHFFGRRPVETMPMYYEKSDALLVILRDDPIFAITIPSKVQTYMASGRPILSAVNGEVSLLVKESGCGLSAKSGDPQELANQIEKLVLTDEEQRKVMSDNASSYYRENFKREKAFERALEHINSLS